MDIFPKKYNYKKITKNNNTKNGTKIISPFVPMDQKINPGIVFSEYYKDLMIDRGNIMGQDFARDTGFGLSSKYYSDTSKGKRSKIAKEIKNNKRFLERLGIEDIVGDSQILTEEFNSYLRSLFAKIYEKKFFVQKEIALWSKELHTNLPKFSVKKEPKDVVEYSLKYFIESKGYVLPIVTTSIETIFADVAVAVNPNDKRYKKLVGQNVIIPIINKAIPIISDESVDVFVGSGVWRVTPGHDSRSLEIAKKYNLPQDIYAIDTDGNFTEHAGIFEGKSLAEFAENIEKYIDDIGNLTSKKIVPGEKYISTYTGEELYPISINQWNICYDYSIDCLYQMISQESIHFDSEEVKESFLQLLDEKKIVNISNKSETGLLIPVVYDNEKGESFPLSDETIVERYTLQKSKKDIVLTLIVLNLILDNVLPERFTVEQLIDVLFSNDFLGDSTKLEKYISMYREKASQDSVFKNGLKKISSLVSTVEKNSENIDEILDLLQDSFAIKQDNSTYFVDYSEIFNPELNLQLQESDSFSKSFIDSVGFCFKYGLKYSSGGYDKITALDLGILASKDEKDLILNILLLGVEYSKILLFQNIYLHNNLVDFKGNKITNFNSKYLTQDLYENLNVYGADVLRLTILLGENYEDSDNTIFDTYVARDYNLLLNKIWNANRYVFTKFCPDSKKVMKIEELLNNINSDISDCDVWLLHNIKSFLDDLQYQLENRDYISLGKKIFQFYKDIICEKYLQAIKISYGENTSSVALLAFAIFNRLVQPYIPDFSQDLQEKFGFNWEGLSLFDLQSIKLPDRNYKVNVFMDIVDKFLDMKKSENIQKHEISDLYIQASPDFLDFIQECESVIRSLINIGNIDYIGLNFDIPQGYINGNVININIGLKKADMKNTGERNILKELQQEYDEKSEYLQHLKSLLASISSSCPSPELLAKKREQIQTLQSELEDLEYKIGQLKINK